MLHEYSQYCPAPSFKFTLSISVRNVVQLKIHGAAFDLGCAMHLCYEAESRNVEAEQKLGGSGLGYGIINVTRTYPNATTECLWMSTNHNSYFSFDLTFLCRVISQNSI
jgi:hypothetical protein